MARPGLTKHRKFLRLSRLLGNRHKAYGVLGLLWESAYESGDPVMGDAEDVEAICDWDGDVGKLASALQACGGNGPGFLVVRNDGRLEVHDFWAHAPTYVRRRAEREAERNAKGKSLSEIRAEAGRRGAAVTNGKRSANERLFAATPISHMADGSKAAAVENSEQSSPLNFQAAAAVSELVLTQQQASFLTFWNERRLQHGRATERFTADMLPFYDALRSAAEEQYPDAPDLAEGELVVHFLGAKPAPEGDGTRKRDLRTLLSPKVWPERLDQVCAKLREPVRRRL